MDALQCHLGTIILREEMQGMVNQHAAQRDRLGCRHFDLDGCPLDDRQRVHHGGGKHRRDPGGSAVDVPEGR